MSKISYFGGAKNFVAKNTTFNTYVSGIDVLQFLYEHAATGAMHDSDERYPPPLCHPGTREAVIILIKDWYGFLTRPDKPILWIHAPAGYGKTAIAGTISKWLEGVEGLDFSPLGATFYFWRTSPERNSPARFIITLAYQLAMSIPELAPHIDSALKRNPMILRKALEVQLIKLIVEPFAALGELDDMPNRLVIVDGLDECINTDQERRVERSYAEGQEEVQIRVLELIHTLQSHHLPLSFLILSRPEAWIKQHMESKKFESVVEAFDLHVLGDHLNDTEVYVRAELSRIAARIQTTDGGDGEWPEEGLVEKFLGRVNGHMLYASTAIRHIDDLYGNPRDLLKNLVEGPRGPGPDLAHSSSFSSLHELYMQIMRSCPERNRPLMIAVLEDIFECTDHFPDNFDTLRALAVLDRLAGRQTGQGLRAIRPLHAVLRLLPPGTPTHDFVIMDPHWVDFVQSPHLPPEFRTSRENGFHRLLNGCLDCMSKITPQSEITDDHYQFAVWRWQYFFDTLWSDFRGGIKLLTHAQYLQVMEKLLSVDLLACEIKRLASRGLFEDTFAMIGPPIPEVYLRGHRNLIVPGTSLDIFESDPLVQQAADHVVSSHEACLAHFLDQPPDLRPKWFNISIIRFKFAHDRRVPSVDLDTSAVEEPGDE